MTGNRAAARIAAALALAASTSLAAAEPPDLKAGQWRISSEIVVPGRGPDSPPMVRELCLTPQDAAQFAVPPNAPCRLYDVVSRASGVSWKMRCGGGTPSSGSGQISFHGTSFEGSSVTVAGPPYNMRLTQRTAGTYLGPCRLRSTSPEAPLNRFPE